MRSTYRLLVSLACTGTLSLALPRLAAGDDPPAPEHGITVSAGAGVQGFTGKSMRDSASPGGLWDVRAVFGSRAPIAVEAAYVGTAQSVDAPASGRSAALVGTTVEVLARSNVVTGTWQPYGVIGFGYTRYDVTEPFALPAAGMTDRDTLLSIPIGVGVAYRTGPWVADVRATFRLASSEDLLPTTTGAAAMHTWGAAAQLGYEL